MADVVTLLQIVVSTLLGYFFAFLCSLQLLFKFLWAPKTFVKTTFYTERSVMPACLNDQSLGQHQYITLKDIKLHYVISGEESKPLMLFVHGFPEFWYCWKYQIPEFNKDYRTVAIDMRDYGDSDKPSGVSNYTQEKIVEDIKQLITALGYSSCVLVGHDFGGIVSWNFVYSHPDMVDKLIIMNAPNPYAFSRYLRSNLKQFMKSWYMSLFKVPLIPELLISVNDLEAFSAMIEMLDDNPTPDELEAYKYAFSSKVMYNLETFGTMIEMLDDNPTLDELEAYKYTFSSKGAVQCPLNYYRAYNPFAIPPSPRKLDTQTLVIWGEPDMAFNTEVSELGRDDVPNMTVKIVKNSNHFVQSKTPLETNRLMREFLSTK